MSEVWSQLQGRESVKGRKSPVAWNEQKIKVGCRCRCRKSKVVKMSLLSEINKPLNCEVEGNQLVIRIGVGTLAFCCKEKNGGSVPNNYRMLDKHQWAKDVEWELMREDELGNTLLTRALGKAEQAALDHGSTALAYAKPPNNV